MDVGGGLAIRNDAARAYLTLFQRTAPPAQYAKEIEKVSALLAQL